MGYITKRSSGQWFNTGSQFTVRLNNNKACKLCIIRGLREQNSDYCRQLPGIDINVQAEVVGALLLAGLPNQWQPMIMASDSSDNKIPPDMVKTKIRQEVKSGYDTGGFFTYPEYAHSTHSYQGNSYRGFCFSCNKYDYLVEDCPEPKQSKYLATAFTVHAEEDPNSEVDDVVCAYLRAYDRHSCTIEVYSNG